MIKIYSTKSCHWCVTVKNYLKSKNIEFKNIDVTNDIDAMEEMLKKSNQMGVPVLDINGHIIIGFDKDAIDNALTALN